MKANIIISPSQQIHNQCVVGDSEADHCRLISEKVIERLKKYDCNVLLIPEIIDDGSGVLSEVVKLSNAFVSENVADYSYHLDVHTDAGYSATGTSGFYVSEGGKAFIQKIHREISFITPWTDGLISKRNLYVLDNTKAIAGLIELSFHDKQNEAKWIHENMDLIAEAITAGIVKGTDIQVIPEPKHWADEYFEFLNKKGIKIHEKRFDDNITRGETMALLAQIIAKKEGSP